MWLKLFLKAYLYAVWPEYWQSDTVNKCQRLGKSNYVRETARLAAMPSGVSVMPTLT